MAPADSGPNLAVLGAGAVARALATALGAARRPFVLWARRPAAAADIARAVGVQTAVAPDLAAALAGTDVLLFCVGDEGQEALAHQVANALRALPSGTRTPAVALTTSGVYEAAGVLSALRAVGVAVGSLHPLVPVAGAVPRTLAGSWFAIEGEERAREVAARLVADLRGEALRLLPGGEAKRAYHAAAALLAGGTVALFDLAQRTAQGAVDEPERIVRRAFAALLRETLANLEAAPPAAALTGPLVRGDAGVVGAHLELLRARGADAALDAYRVLSRHLLDLARARGTDAGALERIARQLGA